MWFKNKNYLLVLLLPLSHTMGLRSSVQDESIFHRVHGYRVPLLKKLKEKEHDMEVCKIGEFYGDERACCLKHAICVNRKDIGTETLTINNGILIDTSPEDAEKFVAALAQETDSNVISFGKEDKDRLKKGESIRAVYSRRFHEAHDLGHKTGKVTILHLKGMHEITPREKRSKLAACGWVDVSDFGDDPSLFILMSTDKTLDSLYRDMNLRLQSIQTIRDNRVFGWFENQWVQEDNNFIYWQNVGIGALNAASLLSVAALIVMGGYWIQKKSVQLISASKQQLSKLCTKISESCSTQH